MVSIFIIRSRLSRRGIHHGKRGSHNLNIGHWDVQQGMHYQPMATADHRSVVQVEERDQEEFKFKVVWHFHHRQW